MTVSAARREQKEMDNRYVVMNCVRFIELTKYIYTEKI